MKRAHRRREGKGGIDLVEEATHRLRTAPAATLAAYYSGTIPFVLGLLYFWADMSRSPFAPQHLAGASLGLTGLFLWMKFWQTIFARRIRAQVAGVELPPLDFRRGARILLVQTILQPTGLFVLPLSLVPLLPFAWVYAFYQNVTVLAEGDEKNTSSLLKKSWAQACLWPRQNHIALGILAIFGGCVFLNWMVAGLMVPQLIKMLFGVESVFTQSPLAMLNTTFFAGMCGLTYLCMDPILKTLYALRCFYGESLESGEDLKSELKPFTVPTRQAVALLVILLALAFGWPEKLPGAEPATSDVVPSVAPASARPGMPPTDLDQVINQTIHERKYTWRMPRDKVLEPDSDGNIFTRFFDRLGAMLREWVRAVSHWLERMIRKLFPKNHEVDETSSGFGYGWILSLRLLLYGLVAAAVAALLIFLLRVWRGRRRVATAMVSEPIQLMPDLTDENVRADQLPEDGWTKLALELLERGEFRLAMRAFYLASLAHLAARNLIHLARFKSNRDYERELGRRAHSLPDLLSVFGDNLSVFERIWYGMHEVNRELVDGFAANVERIRAGG